METGMILLTITATLTSLVTEAVKKTLNIDNKKVSLNALTAAVSVICALLTSFGYIIIADIVITPKVIVYICSLIVLSTLVAECGYDKVVQLIGQLNLPNK